MPRPVMPYVQKERTRHGRAVYYFRANKDSCRIRLPDEYGSSAFFKAYGLAMEGVKSVRLPRGISQTAEKRIREALSRCVSRASDRAKEKNFAFDINVDWVTAQVIRQGFRCALTNIPFYFKKEPSSRNPYAPSIDRIDCSSGYTRGNVRIVAYAINIMLLDWGEDVFSHIAESYKANKGRSIPAHGIIPNPSPAKTSNENNAKKMTLDPGGGAHVQHEIA